VIVLITEPIFHLSNPEEASAPDGNGTTQSAMQKTMDAVVTRFATTEATLSAMQKTMEAIKTRLDSSEPALSAIPKNVEA